MIIYVDMDGVIADFFGGLERKFNATHWKQIPHREASIDTLKLTDFFFTLEKYDTSDELIEFVKVLADSTDNEWGICSSPLRGDRDNSAYWKRRWLEHYGYMPMIDNLIFTGAKEQYAVDKIDGSPNILIDDKPSNIDAWNKAGGVGILYQANQDSFEKLKQHVRSCFQATGNW